MPFLRILRLSKALILEYLFPGPNSSVYYTILWSLKTAHLGKLKLKIWESPEVRCLRDEESDEWLLEILFSEKKKKDNMPMVTTLPQTTGKHTPAVSESYANLCMVLSSSIISSSLFNFSYIILPHLIILLLKLCLWKSWAKELTFPNRKDKQSKLKENKLDQQRKIKMDNVT